MFLLFFILMLVTQHALGVEVIEGAESVVLTCEAPPGKASSVTWSREDLNPSNVHFRQKTDQPEEDDHTNQNPLFKSRTEVHPDALRTGHVSLTLKHIQLKDGGIYSCIALDVERERLTETQVELQVTSRAEIELREARRQRDALIAVGIIIFIILCIVAVVLGLLYYLGYIWQKVQQVEVDSGVESVPLRYRTIKLLPKDVRVQWTAGGRMVHVSLKGSDQPGEQDKLYRGRTEMKRDLRILVDLSLTLKHPTVRDSKIYTCTVYSREEDVLMVRHVMLKVKEQQVEVEQGAESVELPFKTTDLPGDVRVEWRRRDPMETVHVFQDSSDQQDQQDPSYRGRTEMKGDLRQGDVSLTLKHPTERDEGQYISSVYSKEGDIIRETTVCLWFKVQQVEVEQGAESVLLPFKTTELPGDVRVEWIRLDTLKTIHVFQDGSDQQDQSYRGDTEMRRDLRHGDVSLILKHPTKRDGEVYICNVYSREGDIRREKTVYLSVKDQQVEAKRGEESDSLL